jgi:hypothetical protein
MMPHSVDGCREQCFAVAPRAVDMLEKIISGGQTGADRGGLLAAEEMGIETGGWAPKGFKTERGSDPELGTRFGLQETNSGSYPPRTYNNVRDSDGTMRFAWKFESAGEKCTQRAIDSCNKPQFDVKIPDVLVVTESWVEQLPPVEEAVKWIKDNNITVLNVAGNKETTYPRIEELVKDYLIEVICYLQNE